MYIKLKNKTDSNRVGGRYIVGQQKLFNDLSNGNVWCLDLESELKKYVVVSLFLKISRMIQNCLKMFKNIQKHSVYKCSNNQTYWNAIKL